MVIGLWYNNDPDFGFLSWFWRCKEHPCPLSPHLGLWMMLEVPDWGLASCSWFGYSQEPCSELPWSLDQIQISRSSDADSLESGQLRSRVRSVLNYHFRVWSGLGRVGSGLGRVGRVLSWKQWLLSSSWADQYPLSYNIWLCTQPCTGVQTIEIWFVITLALFLPHVYAK